MCAAGFCGCQVPNRRVVTRSPGTISPSCRYPIKDYSDGVAHSAWIDEDATVNRGDLSDAVGRQLRRFDKKGLTSQPCCLVSSRVRYDKHRPMLGLARGARQPPQGLTFRGVEEAAAHVIEPFRPKLLNGEPRFAKFDGSKACLTVEKLPGSVSGDYQLEHGLR